MDVLIAYQDTSTHYRWRCDGQDGGSNLGMCSKTKCSSGWVCAGNYRQYRNNDCSYSSRSYCTYGCQSGSCNSALPPLPPPSSRSGGGDDKYNTDEDCAGPQCPEVNRPCSITTLENVSLFTDPKAPIGLVVVHKNQMLRSSFLLKIILIKLKKLS